jgi:uncharacterized protein (DUF305 family)
METKPLLYGLIGFFLGGFIVAVSATTFDKPSEIHVNNDMPMDTMSMEDMAGSLKNKTGDEFDEAFITNMIIHHEGAVAMAKLSATNAKHDEIKQLSKNIITAQEKEIAEMKQWQSDWHYVNNTSRH